MEKTFLSPKQVSKMFGLSEGAQTERRRAWNGKRPDLHAELPYFTCKDGAVRYRREDVIAHLSKFPPRPTKRNHPERWGNYKGSKKEVAVRPLSFVQKLKFIWNTLR